jgi:hypothetical protein
MAVPMMNIRIVTMRMPKRRVGVFVSVGFTLVPGKVMGVLMVFIMNVWMTVTHRFVGMLVHVFLSQMKPDPRSHQSSGQPEQETRGIM